MPECAENKFPILMLFWCIDASIAHRLSKPSNGCLAILNHLLMRRVVAHTVLLDIGYAIH